MKYLIILATFVAGYLSGQDKPVAEVGKWTIALSKFKEKYKPMGNVNRDSLKQVVLDDLIADKLMLIDAYDKGLDTAVAEQMKSFENRLAVSKLYDRVVIKEAKVSPMEVRNEWWHTGITLKLSQIAVKDKNALRDVYRELRKGVDFADVARKYSTDYQAKYGGEMGEVRWGQLEPQVQKVAFSLKPGKISRPVKVRDEYRILKLSERKEIRGRNFATEKDNIAENLRRKNQAELANKYLEHLRKIAHPKYNLAVIDEVSKEASKSPDSISVNNYKTLLNWVGGKFTVGYLLEKASMEVKMGRLSTPESIKNWLLNHLTYEFLLPFEASRYHFNRLPDVKKQIENQEETLLLREYQNREIDAKVSITDDELKALFEANRVNYGGKTAKFEQVQARVRWDLEREKKKERREETIRDLKERVPVEIFWANFKEDE